MELSHISGKSNPITERFSYISKSKNPKKFFIFQETEFSYILGGTSKALKTKICWVSLKKFMNTFFYKLDLFNKMNQTILLVYKSNESFMLCSNVCNQ